MFIYTQSTIIPLDAESDSEHLCSYTRQHFIHHRSRKSWSMFWIAIFSDHIDHPHPTSTHNEYGLILYLNFENHRDRTSRWKSRSRSRIFEIRDFSEIWYILNALASSVMFCVRKNAPAPSTPHVIWSKMHPTRKLLNLFTNPLLASLEDPTMFPCS